MTKTTEGRGFVLLNLETRSMETSLTHNFQSDFDRFLNVSKYAAL